MQDQLTYYHDLLEGYILNRLDTAGVDELFTFIRLQPQAYQQLLKQADIQQLLALAAGNVDLPPVVSKRMEDRLHQHIGRGTAAKARKIPVWRWYAAAAAILLIGAGSLMIWQQQQKKTLPGVVQNTKVEAQPGHAGAILTLADGRRIVLDSAGNSTIPSQGGAAVLLGKGSLSYRLQSASTEVVYNTMETPYGRQYSIGLPDGTKVWLNAGSSLRYPTAFNGATRQVFLTGEAYFEVAKNKAKPFHVQVSGMDVAVLGTHFEINSYSDEPAVSTTLLEGSVQVTKGTQSLLLSPGQQASLPRGGRLRLIAHPDIEQVMAWKSGLFNFEGADLQTVLRQLGRWYNVEVVFEAPVPHRTFGGEMPMNLNLSEVLTLLGKLDIQFRMEGRRLIVVQ